MPVKTTHDSASLNSGNRGIRTISHTEFRWILLATPERVLEKLALTVARLLAKVERVLAVLVLAVEKSLQNPMPLGSFTNVVELT